MSKIKVIKKNAIREFDYSLKPNEVKPKSKKCEMVETVENWVVDWRRHTEIKTRFALDELTRSKLQGSTGI
jgi:hypothetical protein